MASNIDRDYDKALTFNNVAVNVPAVPASGDPVRYLGFTGISLIDEGTDVASATTVFIGPYRARHMVNAVAAINVGDPIYFDDTATGSPATHLNTDSVNGIFYGIALEALLITETAEILVHHPTSTGA